MSSDTEIHRTYLEDKEHPYYSVQRGRPFRTERTDRKETGPVKVHHSNVHLTWGHFKTALQRALAG